MITFATLAERTIAPLFCKCTSVFGKPKFSVLVSRWILPIGSTTMGCLGHGWRIFSLVAACILALSVAASATTYYIDYAAGSDSNSGTSTAAPWQHMPGMHGCIATCAKTTPKAGDSFILKGGVTWPNAAFPITWSWSGTSSAPIYIGVDQTWYTGSSWSRPIFNAGGKPISGSKNEFIWSPSVSYVTWDNIEMTGLNWSTSYAYGHLACGYFAETTYVTLSNWYVHGWSHTGGVTTDGFICVIGYGGSTASPGDLITHMVFDGSDSITGGTSGAMIYVWPSVTYSICHDVPDCLLLAGDGEVAYNLIYNINADFDAATHADAIQLNADDGRPFYIHDNVIHDVNIGEPMFLGTPRGLPAHTVYVWNNVLYNLYNDVAFNLDARYGNWTGYYFNNTATGTGGGRNGTGNCFQIDSAAYTVTLFIENNHCITTGALHNIASMAPLDPVTEKGNVTMTPTEAAAAGYSATQTYVYSPTSSNCSGQSHCPVGAGTNLASMATGALAILQSDTTYACTQNAANQSVCPSRTSNRRSAGSAWDAGAYLYSAGGAAPAAPKGLTAVVH